MREADAQRKGFCRLWAGGEQGRENGKLFQNVSWEEQGRAGAGGGAFWQGGSKAG